MLFVSDAVRRLLSPTTNYLEGFQAEIGRALDFAGSGVGQIALDDARARAVQLPARLRQYLFSVLGVAAVMEGATRSDLGIDEAAALLIVHDAGFADYAHFFVTAFQDNYPFLLSRLSDMEKDYLRGLLA